MTKQNKFIIMIALDSFFGGRGGGGRGWEVCVGEGGGRGGGTTERGGGGGMGVGAVIFAQRNQTSFPLCHVVEMCFMRFRADLLMSRTPLFQSE